MATPVTASHTHGQNGAPLHALVEGDGLLAGNFGLVFTEFETHAAPDYSLMTSKCVSKMRSISSGKFASSLETMLSRR
jgi:hypothetical protein